MTSVVPEYATGLERAADGVWYASDRRRVSYPDEGNTACAAVEAESFWFRHRNQVILAAVETYSSPSDLPIFDLGGGNGFVALALSAAGYDTVLVEPGPAGAKLAADRGVRDVICATAETAGFRPGSLPAVGMFDVLEHIDDHIGFLRAVRSALRPDGLLYLTVPAFRWLWSVEDDHAGHYRRYTTATLRAALTSAGFRVEYASYFFALLTPAVFALRAVPTALGLRRPPTVESMKREHGTGSPFTRRLTDLAFGYEVGRVRRGRRLPIGTSCVCVARVSG